MSAPITNPVIACKTIKVWLPHIYQQLEDDLRKKRKIKKSEVTTFHIHEGWIHIEVEPKANYKDDPNYKR